MVTLGPVLIDLRRDLCVPIAGMKQVSASLQPHCDSSNKPNRTCPPFCMTGSSLMSCLDRWSVDTSFHKREYATHHCISKCRNGSQHQELSWCLLPSEGPTSLPDPLHGHFGRTAWSYLLSPYSCANGPTSLPCEN